MLVLVVMFIANLNAIAEQNDMFYINLLIGFVATLWIYELIGGK